MNHGAHRTPIKADIPRGKANKALHLLVAISPTPSTLHVMAAAFALVLILSVIAGAIFGATTTGFVVGAVIFIVGVSLTISYCFGYGNGRRAQQPE